MQSKKSNTEASRREASHATFVWLGAVLLEGVAVWLVVWILSGAGQWAWIAAIACHLGAAGVLLAFGFNRKKVFTKNRHRARLYGLLVLFLPVMGLIGCLVLQLVCDRWVRAHGIVKDFQDETAQRVIEAKGLDIQKDLTAYFDEELAVQPVLDILAGYDDDLKRGAIDTLRRIGTPEAISILKKCLSDSSTEVRHNAHTALTRLDETYVHAIKDAKKPLEAGEPKAVHHLRHAGHCIEYAKSGLLDNDTRRYYLEIARESYLAAREAGASNSELNLNLGRLELQLGNFDQATDYFQSILDEDPNNVTALVGLAEVHYTRGDAGRLQAVVRRMKTADADTVGETSVNDGILLHFWTSLPKEV